MPSKCLFDKGREILQKECICYFIKQTISVENNNSFLHGEMILEIHHRKYMCLYFFISAACVIIFRFANLQNLLYYSLV